STARTPRRIAPAPEHADSTAAACDASPGADPPGHTAGAPVPHRAPAAPRPHPAPPGGRPDTALGDATAAAGTSRRPAPAPEHAGSTGPRQAGAPSPDSAYPAPDGCEADPPSSPHTPVAEAGRHHAVHHAA